DGHIVIDLYNTCGRLMTDMRRRVFRMTRGAGTWIDPYLRSVSMSKEKRRAWYADQYCHPHESKHTIGEVLQWFEQAGLTFVRGVPSVTNQEDLGFDDVFKPTSAGSTWNHFCVQTKQILAGSREGGFFIMIGKLPETPARKTSDRGFCAKGVLVDAGTLTI